MCPDVIGHRGARGAMPENTLAGVAYALSIGLRAIEIDVHMTADDVVVVAHDPDVNGDLTRDRDTRWLRATGPRICRTTLTELQAFDVGALRPQSPLGRRFPDQAPLDGQRIPTLRDVLDLCTHQPSPIRLLVEVKSDPVDPELASSALRCAALVADMLNGHGLASNAMIQSFDWSVLGCIRTSHPGLALSYLTRAGPAGAPGATVFAGSPWLDGDQMDSAPEMIAARGGRAWAPAFADLDQRAMERARALGLQVFVWTVNESSAIADMARLGVDGIITDYPARALRVLAEIDA